MKSKLIIRPIEEKDLEEVSHLIIENLREVNSKDYDNGTVEMLVKDYSPELLKPRMNKGKMIVIQGKMELLGVGRFFNGEIFDVFILTTAHHKGIGSKLMDELEKIAKEEGYSEVFLPASKTAIGFYKKRGYTMKKEYKPSKSSYWMSKKLS